MKIYEQAVRKPVSTILIFVGVMVFGMYSLQNLAVDMYPEIDSPVISVITTYPGANASDIETNVTRILEDNLNTVNNLKEITSKSSDNMSYISLEFEWGSDLNEAANDIRDAVGRVQSEMPDEVEQPIIFKFSSSMIPVMVLAVTADESYAALNKILDEKLVNVLNRIDGVGAVTLMGQPKREVQVNVDPRKLEAFNMSVEQLGQIIAAENLNLPGGTLDIGNNTFNIKADNEFDNSDILRKIVIKSEGGKDILLSDVAIIKDTLEKTVVEERIDGKQGVSIIVQKQSGANTVNIAKAVTKSLESIQKTLPKDVHIKTIMDGSDSISASIASLSDTVMFAFLFVILVVLFFLGRWRATFIIALTIPVSLVVSFIYLNLTGGTLNIISLSSLSIAIGMVVDDAIVVLENITKHIERGSSPKEASIYATNEVWLAVIATTLTIVAVFLPMTMITGMEGILFAPLGWIVTLVIVVSTIAAITLTPMLTSLMLKAETKHTYKGLGIVFKPIDRFLDNLDNVYARMLTWSVRHRTMILVSSTIVFIASLFLVIKIPFEFFPPSDNSFIQAEVRLEQNIGIDYTSQVARRIDKLIAEKYPEVTVTSTSVGSSDEGNAFTAGYNTGSYIINYMMSLTRSTERDRSIYLIGDLLRKDLDSMPEIRQYTVFPGGNMGGGVGATSTVDVKVFGYDFNVTNDVALDLKKRISDIPGTRDVQLSRDDLRPEYNIRFDRDRLAYYGLNSATASNYVRNRINGLVASKYREDGDEYDIVVRYDEPFRTSVANVEDILIYNPRGEGIRLSDVANVVEELAPPTIERENRQRVVTVKSSLADGVALGTVADEVNVILANYDLPEGVYLKVGGTLEDQQDSFASLGALALLIIILVYIVMATQFESFKMPLIIMFTMPFALTGVLIALFVTNTPLSLIALIGSIMLIGIVVKNGIVMVDFTNLLRERGSSVNMAVIAAGKSRLRPVLMTSLTTILGMVPLALGIGEGSETWQPMGVAIIGGLTISTVLTLIVIPVVYSVFGSFGIKKERKKLAETNS